MASKKTDKQVAAVPSTQAELRKTIRTLRDTSLAATVRQKAMQAIQAASFGVLDFAAVRGDYTAALREVARDADEELRHRALGILAREQDGFVQQALLEGLQRPDKALVPPAKALQLLSYDPHVGAQAAAKAVLESSADEEARSEALRILAGDPGSVPLLTKLLGDRKESAALRRQAASSMHAVAPDRLQAWARETIMDDGEEPEIVETCLTALDRFGSAADLLANTRFRKRLQQLAKKGTGKLQKLAKRCSHRLGLE